MLLLLIFVFYTSVWKSLDLKNLDEAKTTYNFMWTLNSIVVSQSTSYATETEYNVIH